MSAERLNDELKAVEAALTSLRPTASTIQRDRLLYLAGRASAARVATQRRRKMLAWLWPCTTAASLLAAATFGVLWAADTNTQVVERVVYVQVDRQSTVVAHSAATRSSAPFADWQTTLQTRKHRKDVSPQPTPAPDRSPPNNPKSGSCPRSTRSLT
jgi:hypothetical protein